MQLLWDEFLKIIKDEAGTQVVETWFKAVSLEQWNTESKTCVLRLPNSFVRDWIKEHYLDLIKTHLSRLFHVDSIKLFLLIKEETVKKEIIPASALQRQFLMEDPTTEAPFTPASPAAPATAIVLKPSLPVRVRPSTPVPYKRRYIPEPSLNKDHTFDSFVVGPSNTLAHAAAWAVSQNLAQDYNPLFIYGATGLGKTHLLHAIGNEAQKNLPTLSIQYLSSDGFMNEFIHSIRSNKTSQFRKKYQKVDLLLLDDIQFFSRKEQTQEIFFHIFNELYESRKQIVLSSDTLPDDIQRLHDRLRSRMQSGLVADIQIPNMETKAAILKKKALLSKIELDDDVATYIASQPVSSIRELEGVLIRITAVSSLMHQPATLELAKEVLSKFQDSKRENVSLESILRIVARDYGVTVQEIKSEKRNKTIALARQISFYLMKKLTETSLQTIGACIGDRNHSTVLHSIKKIGEVKKKNEVFSKKLKTLELSILHCS